MESLNFHETTKHILHEGRRSFLNYFSLYAQEIEKKEERNTSLLSQLCNNDQNNGCQQVSQANILDVISNIQD